jgi:hypothetical protein
MSENNQQSKNRTFRQRLLGGDDPRSIRKRRVLGMFLYILGIIVGLILIIIPVWADFEATLFESPPTDDSSFNRLRCPIFIGKDQPGRLSGMVVNSLDRPVLMTVRSRVTEGALSLVRETIDQPTVAPGEKLELDWEVGAKDAIWGNFILFRVYQYPNYPMPSRTGTCGIIVINIPRVHGNLVLALLIFVSSFGMLAGLWIWVNAQLPVSEKTRRASACGFFYLLS